MIKLSFAEGETYALSDLNGILGGLMSAGVVGSGCEVCDMGVNAFIKSGAAVMPDGLLVTVDRDGAVVEKKRYVYFDSGVPTSSDTLPDGNVVLLAELKNKTYADCRRKAKIFAVKED